MFKLPLPVVAHFELRNANMKIIQIKKSITVSYFSKTKSAFASCALKDHLFGLTLMMKKESK